MVMGIRGNKMDTITLPQQFRGVFAFFTKISKETAGVDLDAQSPFDEIAKRRRSPLKSFGSLGVGKNQSLAFAQ